MGIRWDALLARAVAEELHGRLGRARLRAVRFDGVLRDAVMFFREATVVWRMHPERGTVHVLEPREPGADALPYASRVRRVYAPPDERLIVFELLPIRGRRQATDFTVELLGNQWNCLMSESDSGILRHVLHTRTGKRLLRVGQPYVRPEPSHRLGASAPTSREEWTDCLTSEEESTRRRTLVSQIAWTSPLNAEALLAPEPDGGFALWERFVSGEACDPCVLELDSGPQPYPFALPATSRRPTESLLHAFEEVGDPDALGTDSTVLDPRLVRKLDRALEQAERRATSLIAELDNLDDEETLRGLGDLILARYGEIPSGAESATLTDFEGNSVNVELTAGAPAHEQAASYYDRAAKVGRARQRLPALIEKAESDAVRYRLLAERVQAGTVDGDELAAELPTAPPSSQKAEAEEALPFRRYESSGGLEIRVGRGAKHNDALTFKNSAPNDVWLHARHASGAHVILRWGGPGNPPAKDLEEAAILAALHSKARTSGSVPVDYTLRKYVRKPRGAAPGAVLPDRVKTVFVEPDPEVDERLAQR